MPTSKPSDQIKTTSTTLSPSDVDMKTKPVVFVEGNTKKALDERVVALTPVMAICDARLTHAMFRVLAAYCMYRDKSGRTWVSQARICRDTGMPPKTVSWAVRGLRDLGYMCKAPRPRNKYGKAQTHAIFMRPVDQRHRDDEMAAMIAAVGAAGDAPPVSVRGV
jgi:hypothetical protein